MGRRSLPGASLLALAIMTLTTAAEAQPLNAIYVCQDADATRYTMQVHPNGQIEIREGTNLQKTPGTYAYQNRQIRLMIPSIGFDQTSVRAVEQKGLLLGFETPAIFCGLMAHDKGPAVQGYAKCPKIRYVPSVGWQVNAFEFFANRSVKWRRWDEYLPLADTTYSESFGIYLIEGNTVSMVFPFREEEDVLTGTINADQSFVINQLEPQTGACRPSQ